MNIAQGWLNATTQAAKECNTFPTDFGFLDGLALNSKESHTKDKVLWTFKDGSVITWDINGLHTELFLQEA